MNELTNKINDILAKWDPIGVGEEMAVDEYKEYIPMIIQYTRDRQELINYLKKMVVDYMGGVMINAMKNIIRSYKISVII